ncbi:MAG: peptidylprolyl isomerase [Cohaesibacteraceae bacterium]
MIQAAPSSRLSAVQTRILSGLAALAVVTAIAVLAALPIGSARAQTMNTPEAISQLDPQNVLVIEVASGPIYIDLLPDVAPQHVERIQQLASEGFYDGVVFHRVIDGFMAQTGDPTGTGTGGSPYPDLPAEFSSIGYARGVVGMARTNDPNSANSQFFIMFGPAPRLNGAYTVFGRVVSGMDNVDAIKKGDARRNGIVDGPDAMVRARLLADLNG